MSFFSADKYEESKNKWIEKKYWEFVDAIKLVISDEDFLHEIADSIAWSHYNDESCENLFKYHGLDHNNALCYLGETTMRYVEEMDRAYQEYISDLNEE